jgi:hypothetical protein
VVFHVEFVEICALKGVEILMMRVLEQHQHRLPRRQPFDLCHQRLRRPLLLLLRGEIGRRIALARAERQQCCQQ